MHRTFYEYLMTLRNPMTIVKSLNLTKNAFLDQSFPKQERITID